MSTTLRNLRAVLAVSATLLAGGSLLAVPAQAAPLPSTTTVPTITTVAGTGHRGFSGNGDPAVKAKLQFPAGVAEDAAGTLYIADTANNRIRQVVLPTTIHQDIITTVAGRGGAGFSGDGGPATKARLDDPSGVAVDSQGDVFIADTGNNRVREVSASGIITTIAGDGACGTDVRLGNGRLAVHASLCDPTGVAVDGSGDVFIADTGHNMVRKVDPSGTITDYAGNGEQGLAGNGGKARDAELNMPTGLALDALGNLFIADTGNNEVRVVDTGHVINQFAGTGAAGRRGDGGQAIDARLDHPTGVGIDPSGNVYIADTDNNRIRQVNPAGVIATYAGRGREGFSGDNGPATKAKLDAPAGSIAADGAAVYFSDTRNQRVRGVFSGPPPILPQSPLVILLPIVGFVIIGGLGYLGLRRRHRRSSSVAV